MSRRIDLSLFQGDDSDAEDDLAITKPSLELDGLKAKTFSYGVTKKTKWDLEKEAEAKKRQEEEEATTRALHEFSEAFSTPGGPQGPGGSGWHKHSRGFVRAGEKSVYNPAKQHTTGQQPPTSTAAFPRSPSPPPVPKRKGKRVMDAFLEEIKTNQEAREARLGKITHRTSMTSIEAHENSAGNRNLDQDATNLFVVNLPSDTSEDSLGHLFATVGPVGTVKIMWPRADDLASGSRRTKGGLTGFVSFMDRADAEDALRKFDKYEWNGSLLRVSWSTKPVALPRRPAYEAKVTERPTKRVRNDRSAHSTARTEQDPQVALYWFQQVSPHQSEVIQQAADQIKTEGESFKRALMKREATNPKFQFLFDNDSPGHHVFLYCLDPHYEFPEPPAPRFEDEGYASIYSTDSAEESEQVKSTGKPRLGKLSRRRLEAMLRSMTGKRVEIARAMEFALKRAEAAEEITDLICESLRIDSTPIPRKMARLHLISDILHNSASPLPNVWKFRQALEKQLPAIFAHFADVYDRLLVYSGSIAAEVFRQQVDAVLTIWERWIVFTADVHDSLKQLLHRRCTLESLAAGANDQQDDTNGELKAQPVFKSAGFKSSFKRVGDSVSTALAEDKEHRQLVAHSTTPCGENAEASMDVDGEAMDDDGDNIDGAALEGDDLDGELMSDEGLNQTAGFEDIDGQALEEDVDGEAM